MLTCIGWPDFIKSSGFAKSVRVIFLSSDFSFSGSIWNLITGALADFLRLGRIEHICLRWYRYGLISDNKFPLSFKIYRNALPLPIHNRESGKNWSQKQKYGVTFFGSQLLSIYQRQDDPLLSKYVFIWIWSILSSKATGHGRNRSRDLLISFHHFKDFEHTRRWKDDVTS